MVLPAPVWSDTAEGTTVSAGSDHTFDITVFTKGAQIKGLFKIEPVNAGDPVEATLTWQFSQDGTNYIDYGTEEVFNENAAYQAQMDPSGYPYWKAKVENTGSNDFKLYASVIVR